MRLAGERAVAPLASFRIDRQHAGTEDEAASADSRRLVVSVMLPQIEPGERSRNDFTHGASLGTCRSLQSHWLGSSVRELRHAGQKEPLDVAGRLHIAQAD